MAGGEPVKFFTDTWVKTALFIAHRAYPDSPVPLLVARLLELDTGNQENLPGWPEGTLAPPLGGWRADRSIKKQLMGRG